MTAAHGGNGLPRGATKAQNAVRKAEAWSPGVCFDLRKLQLTLSQKHGDAMDDEGLKVRVRLRRKQIGHRSILFAGAARPMPSAQVPTIGNWPSGLIRTGADQRKRK